LPNADVDAVDGLVTLVDDRVNTDGGLAADWSRWLMTVSTPMAVLPICRSPMINSRCPRPNGMTESIALMPVCSGSLTGVR
jgi:hypothetical protein